MKSLILSFITLFIFSISFAQVGIGNTNPDASSLLDISNAAGDKGILIPRVDIADLSTAAPVTTPLESLLVYNTNATTGTGFYYWDSTKWTRVAPIRIDDLEDGKSDVDGTQDGSSVYLGINAGDTDDSSDNKNTGIGYQTLQNVVGTDATSIGQNNTAIGYRALRANTDGNNNVAIGQTALVANTTGKSNVAVGQNALNDNIGGESNVAIGISSQGKNISGINNVALGSQSLRHNATGDNNTALGDYALRGSLAVGGAGNVGSSSFNVAVGNNALQANESGDNNVAVGSDALKEIVSTTNNTAIGYQAGSANTGTANVFVGYQAGKNELGGSNTLYIANSSTATPLIHGDFSTNQLTINGTTDVTNGLTVTTGGLTVAAGGADITGKITANNGLDVIATGITVTAGGLDVTAGNGITTTNITVGATGTQITNIIKATVTLDLPSISGNSAFNQDFTVTGATTGSSVIISPQNNFTNRLAIAVARVRNADTVQVRFVNIGGAAVDLASMDWYITVIK